MWSSDVIASLCDAKRSGVRFDVAWERAMVMFPPRGPGFGQRQLSLMAGREEPLDAFLRRAAEDAWHGRRPYLAHLSPDLMDVREGLGMFSGRAA